MGGIAYVDESEPRGSAVYLLVAALVPARHADSVRAGMRTLLLPGQQKVHWNREPRRHGLLASAVADTAIHHLVVVRSADDAESSERRRRLCLKRLLQELDRLTEIEGVVLEARQAKQNLGDRRLLDVLRAGREVSGRLRMSHVPGPEEPLLWMPDIVAGAFGAALQGRGDPLSRLVGRVAVYEA